MLDTPEFLTRARLDADVLETWIEAGWLLPSRDEAGWRFSEVDLARVQLIHDLREHLGINDEGVPVILDLLDQIHGLRRTLWELLSAVYAQPEPMRHRIAADIRNGIGSDVTVEVRQAGRLQKTASRTKGAS